MDKMVLRVFQREIQKQCEFALISATYINDTISNIQNTKSTNQLWYFVQNFLIPTANVSKLLWGSKERIAESRKELRESLNISDDSLLKSRIFRNHFEHYDERVETWAVSSKNKNFIDSNIGPISGFEASDFFRNFDPNTMAVTFQGSTYELKPIIDELVKVHEIAEHEANKPHQER